VSLNTCARLGSRDGAYQLFAMSPKAKVVVAREHLTKARQHERGVLPKDLSELHQELNHFRKAVLGEERS
jgi:hypothetical protein